MTLLTTLQVRTIMRANGLQPAYTNKTTGHRGNDRRVKAYTPRGKYNLQALRDKCGAENVTITNGSDYRNWPGITVKCVLA